MGVASIINHINFARDWLSSAENSIFEGELVEGEMYLSLAESEVRRAWEKSLAHRNNHFVREFNFSRLVIVGLIVVLLITGINIYGFILPARTENLELNLAESYQQSISLQKVEDLRLINIDLSINNN